MAAKKLLPLGSDLNSTTSWKVHYLETTFVFSSVHVFGFFNSGWWIQKQFPLWILTGTGTRGVVASIVMAKCIFIW